ncbi:hypothetical protein WR164_04170 [Philodulcilactobacillus myokoensis]|uniref:Uncharacterized protein n=1 Tax=Philodulcilactobacillus myokoensis TaxID=2929573 RepID=A0A9W6B132_9LACO|nr:hypothetical protein [Philodulcilactobacillus myokoensis]GLB46438.1 hypothetical protein WR164_04170 [Philodulcilactobacillus myokoensis]
MDPTLLSGIITAAVTLITVVWELRSSDRRERNFYYDRYIIEAINDAYQRLDHVEENFIDRHSMDENEKRDNQRNTKSDLNEIITNLSVISDTELYRQIIKFARDLNLSSKALVRHQIELEDFRKKWQYRFSKIRVGMISYRNEIFTKMKR